MVNDSNMSSLPSQLIPGFLKLCLQVLGRHVNSHLLLGAVSGGGILLKCLKINSIVANLL